MRKPIICEPLIYTSRLNKFSANQKAKEKMET